MNEQREFWLPDKLMFEQDFIPHGTLVLLPADIQ